MTTVCGPTKKNGGRTQLWWAIVLVLLASGCSSLDAAARHASAAPLDERQQACLECAIRRNRPEQGQVPPAPEALSHFQRACRGGDLRACSVLGVMYEQGHLVARDEAQAMQLYWRACRAGNGGACVNLGALLDRGPTRDPEAAALMFDMGCRAGSREGCQRLALVQAQPPVEGALETQTIR